ncbi:class I SAM-dependent methyltransferase [Sansalvadorimonas verongulae]|uniref:class I SAM-dependent methyltransferase n=1 Tax=Sansalvadorimonas verongulae TaxID=2172824 RepID=UPI0012BCE61E|nr:class I SAM-dependent methyltransferase [Sansalvadorimonas verongulae]MTI12324.1 class I SAM-dependent methyltransferase [Sansalvadorimonas verongulae]
MTIDFYNINADSFYESTIDADMSQQYARFTEHLPANASVLDAGCGSGRDSKAFLTMGYDVTAFDASHEMVSRAKALTGLDIQLKQFDQFQTERQFDGIWSCASLLHISLINLPAILSRLEGMLSAGGVWYLSFKYGIEEREKGGRHFTDLNENALENLIRPLTRLQIQSVWITDDVRPGRDEQWLNAILRKQ